MDEEKTYKNWRDGLRRDIKTKLKEQVIIDMYNETVVVPPIKEALHNAALLQMQIWMFRAL